MEFNNLSKQPSNKYLGVVVNFDDQKDQATGKGWGWRYKVAIMDSYSNTIDIADAEIEYAICIFPVTAGSGGAGRSKSAKIAQGDVVVLEKISGIPHIVGLYGRTSQIVYGEGRFDAKSGFYGGLKPGNILNNQEINQCSGHCTPRPLNTGSGSDKSQKRETPTNKLEEMGVDPDKEPKPGEFKSPEVDPTQEEDDFFEGTAEPLDPSEDAFGSTTEQTPAEAAAQRERIRQRQTVDRALGKINTGDIAVQPGGIPVNRTPTSEELQKFESNGYRFIEDEPGSGSGGRIIKRVGQNYG